MGKGDKKTRRGKINNGSYGKTRPKRGSRSFVAAETVVEEKPKAKKAKKTEE